MSQALSSYGEQITIEVVKGGFILVYPVLTDKDGVLTIREIFVSPRKLNQKLKEIIDNLSTVPETD